MTRVIVPVRFPLSTHSVRTLRRAVDIANERDAELTVLHVNLYQNGQNVSRRRIKESVEEIIGPRSNIRYVIRGGFLVEETILDEIAAEEADVVVIGHKQAPRWRRTLAKLTDDPDIETYLKERLDCTVITVS